MLVSGTDGIVTIDTYNAAASTYDILGVYTLEAGRTGNCTVVKRVYRCNVESGRNWVHLVFGTPHTWRG